MASNIGPYNYPPQYPQQGNFNGNPAMSPMADKAVEQAQNTGVGQMASYFPTTGEEWVKFLPMAGAGLGVSYGMKVLIDKITKGKFEDSKLHKWANAIDNTVDKNKVVKGAVTSVDSFIKSSINRIKGIPLPDSAREVIDRFKKGSQPRFTMARGFIGGITGQAADDVVGGFRHLVSTDNLKHLDDKVIQNLKGILEDQSLTSKQALKKIRDLNIIDSIPIAKLQNIEITKVGKFRTSVKKVDLNLALNKLKFIEGGEGRTFLSKFFQKAVPVVGESVGGAVVGGLSGVFMNALFLGLSFREAQQAPKGERFSKFMEDFSGNMIGGFIMMPIVGDFLYHVAELRNIGNKHVIEEALKKKPKLADKIKLASKGGTIDDGIAQLVAKLGDKSISKQEFNAIKKEIKALKSLSLSNTTLLQKPFKLLGKLTSIGLDKIPARGLGKVADFARRFAGGASRFALVFILLQPFTKLFMKISHKIFGKPSNSQLDEGKKTEEAKKADKQGLDKQPNPFNKPADTKANAPVQNPTIQNFLKQPQQKASQQQPAPAQAIQQQNQQPVRTYIPQPTPVSVTTTTSNDAIFQKSDRIMEHADKVLKDLGAH